MISSKIKHQAFNIIKRKPRPIEGEPHQKSSIKHSTLTKESLFNRRGTSSKIKRQTFNIIKRKPRPIEG